MPTRSNIYNISSFNYKKMDDLTKLSNGIWTFPNLSFHNEEILNVYISILHSEFSNTIYIVNENNNKLFINDIITGLQTITFSVGNYNVNNFMDMFNLLTPAGYSMSYNKITNKLSVVGPNSFSILASSTCTYILGLGASDLSSISNSVTFPFCINLLPTARFNLRSTAFRIGNFGVNNSNDLLITIQNTGGTLSRCLYQNYGDLKFKLDVSSLQSFDFRITDDYNNLLNFNGAPWYVTFQLDIEYVEKPKPLTFEQVLESATKSRPKPLTKLALL